MTKNKDIVEQVRVSSVVLTALTNRKTLVDRLELHCPTWRDPPSQETAFEGRALNRGRRFQAYLPVEPRATTRL